MIRDRVPIAVEGFPFVAGSGAISILFFLLGWSMPTILFSILTLFIIWFFRNPERTIPYGKDIVISPADGKIICINEVVESRILKERMVKFSIFMNVFNVHINRIPCTGRITDIIYNPGKFVSANREKASLENEQNAIVLETFEGKKILFIQIAGLIARRIVCWLNEGDSVGIGQRFGLIRFGSRVDIYLPLNIDIKVLTGQKVKGGESILAVINEDTIQ